MLQISLLLIEKDLGNPKNESYLFEDVYLIEADLL